MSIPTVSEKCALAFIQKQHMDANGPGEWTAKKVHDFSKEQPILLSMILENIKECFDIVDIEEMDDQDKLESGSAAGKALYITLMTYGLIKAAVEGEQLNELFGEDDHE